MLNLARLLAAVTAVTERRTPAVTTKTPPDKGCTAVTVQSGTDHTHPAPSTESPTDAPSESLARVSSSNRTTRNSRTGVNDAGSAVTAAERGAVQAVTAEPCARAWRVNLTDGTHLVAVRHEGCIRVEMLATVREQFGGHRVLDIEAPR